MSWKQIITTSCLLTSAFLYLIYTSQEKILYLNETIPPKKTTENPPPFANPMQQGMKYKTIWMKTKDNLRLHAWFIPCNPKVNEQNIHKPIDMQAMMQEMVLAQQYLQQRQQQTQQQTQARIYSDFDSNNKAQDSENKQNQNNDDDNQAALELQRSVPTLIFFHANAGNMGYRLPNLKALHERLKVNLFIFSYRGYGNSDGEPHEDGIMLDADCAFEYVYNKLDINKKKIFLFGRSLGGAVAIYTANKYSSMIAGLIIENTFLSISDMVGKVFPFLNFQFVKQFMLKIHWRSCDRIGKITAPMQFFASDNDEVVPHNQMLQMFELATQAKEKDLMVVYGGAHNDAWMKGGYNYWFKLKTFLNKHEIRPMMNKI